MSIHPATLGKLTMADQLYSNVAAFPSASIIIDRITDRIEAPIPKVCREFLCYVTGANMVHDRLGEAVALGKLPATATIENLPTWQKIDQARYELVNDYIIARGTQADGKNYSRFRCLVNFVGARILAGHDASRISSQWYGNNDEGQAPGGIYIDNFDTSPDRSFGSVDEAEHYFALGAYIRDVLGDWPGCSIWVNAPQPHVFRNNDGSYAAGGSTRFVTWAQTLGIAGIYYEGNKWAKAGLDERTQIEDALRFAVEFGMSVCVGCVGGPGWEPLYATVSNNGVEQSVYCSL